MADPIFDKEGNLTNLEELSKEEVAAAYSEKNKGIFGRLTEEERLRKEADAKAAKAEQELELAKKPKEPPVVEPKTSAAEEREELRLVARGLSDEELDEAKAIAKGKGITLLEALKDKTFILYQENLREEKKKEDAKLGASRGSGQTLTEKPVKSGMTRDEHKAAFDEARGKLT